MCGQRHFICLRIQFVRGKLNWNCFYHSKYRFKHWKTVRLKCVNVEIIWDYYRIMKKRWCSSDPWSILRSICYSGSRWMSIKWIKLDQRWSEHTVVLIFSVEYAFKSQTSKCNFSRTTYQCDFETVFRFVPCSMFRFKILKWGIRVIYTIIDLEWAHVVF